MFITSFVSAHQVLSKIVRNEQKLQILKWLIGTAQDRMHPAEPDTADCLHQTHNMILTSSGLKYLRPFVNKNYSCLKFIENSFFILDFGHDQTENHNIRFLALIGGFTKKCVLHVMSSTNVMSIEIFSMLRYLWLFGILLISFFL